MALRLMIEENCMDGVMELMVSWAILLLKCLLSLEKLDTFMIKTYESEPCLVVYDTLLLSIEKVTSTHLVTTLRVSVP